MPPKLLVLCGPTASGKTDLAVALALEWGGEVVSADSMQLYRGMDIGTAKPSCAERRGVAHHMLDVADPAENWSVARYVAAATDCIDAILARGKLPILAGGTGLYIDSLLSGRTFAPFTGLMRESLQLRAAQEGMPALYAELARIDPVKAAALHISDEKRILRALEIWYETGETMTDHDARTRALPPRYEALSRGLSARHRADLCQRIDLRVDQMMARGLEDEVEALLRSGVSRTCTAMQAIGYKELAAAMEAGRNPQEAAEEIKLRSRQYAKRQLTWFRRNPNTHWLLWDKTPNPEEARPFATAYMEEFGLR